MRIQEDEMVPRYSGSKLRTPKAQRTLHEGEIAIAKQRRDAAEQAVKNEGRIGDGDHEIKFAAGKKLREALADTALYLKIKNILAVVEQMVKDETKNAMSRWEDDISCAD